MEQALLSVRKASQNIDTEVWVVDNNSVDGSVQMVREKFPEVKVIANTQNTGFSKANNQAIKLSDAKYILLLNPDTVVEENTFTSCCQFMDAHPEAGGLGVKMVDGKGVFLPESKRGLPTPWVSFYKIFGLAALFPRSKRFGKYHLTYLDKDQTHEVEVLSGAFMLMRKETLDKVGLLDEDYFMYGEDIDLSYRILLGGYKNYYFAGTRIIHYKGESTKKASVNYVFIFYNAMLIFAKKHFSGKSMKAFSLLINMAIYLRAAMAIAARFARQAVLPLTDALLIAVGMYLLQDYWGRNYKHSPSFYPPEFMQIVVPLYILVWLLSAYFSGVYEKKTRLSDIVQGIGIGTVLISAASNFFDDYRFSKALILMGGGWATVALASSRMLWHFIQYRNFSIDSAASKKVVIVGSTAESKRVLGLLKNVAAPVEVLGFIRTEADTDLRDEHCLGQLSQIQEVINIYKVEEIIFCAKDLTAEQIIGFMIETSGKNAPDYKIVPDGSNYIIGSNSKNAQGDFYSFNVELAIVRKHNRRQKRLFDVFVSLFLLASLPLNVWFVRKKLGYIRNIFQVVFGKKSWVGFSQQDAQVHLPSIRRGVLNPSNGVDVKVLDQTTLRRLDNFYAKDYTVATDVNIVLHGFRYLGN
ncbi:Glycosyltransferase, GT2 family [Flexibacter flexilis DSM 6793]|uniref:Glycosyltransferase, GT2 family n=1 Tax=Flexibacter flexilis DSM 6793 TaxID=927664 RepID=A0A1I1NVW4_9BACT|nr:Glycosyltransferase, GT2 family [Flexibacter flexilis DSM 6793]